MKKTKLAVVITILLLSILGCLSIINQFNKNTLTSPPTTILSPGKPKIIKNNSQIFFKDEINNYSLDLSSIPEVELTDSDVWNIYQFDMYKLQGTFNKSTARFGISEPMDNPDNLSLKDFAKQKYGYKVGKNAPSGWGELITSPITQTTVGNKYTAVNWTEENISTEGYFFDNYLFNFNDKIVLVRMVAWNKSIFDQNKPVMEKILTSFKPSTE